MVRSYVCVSEGFLGVEKEREGRQVQAVAPSIAVSMLHSNNHACTMHSTLHSMPSYTQPYLRSVSMNSGQAVAWAVNLVSAYLSPLE